MPHTRSTWLLLFHQLPQEGGNLRVRVWRRLQKLGAVSVKKSVYVLPDTESSRAGMQALIEELAAEGGDAALCQATFVSGMTDGQVRDLFNVTRNAEYQQIAEEARRLRDRAAAGRRSDHPDDLEVERNRLRKRHAEVKKNDFFDASGADVADALLGDLDLVLSGAKPKLTRPQPVDAASYRRRVWVTRERVHIDRVASAWLISRFIDPEARFRFVNAATYKHKKSELRFDMNEAEFGHEEDRCTFETLVKRFRIEDRAVVRIGEIIHDCDLEDGKFGHAEAAGVETFIDGIALSTNDDAARLELGAPIFDSLYRRFSQG